MRRLIVPFAAAIAAALVLAVVASWADFGDATLTGVAGFVGGVLSVAGTFYALGSRRERALERADDTQADVDTPAMRVRGVTVVGMGGMGTSFAGRLQDIPLAGELGTRLGEELAAVSVTDKPIEMEGLTRRNDGRLQLQVTRETFMVLSGQAELTY